MPHDIIKAKDLERDCFIFFPASQRFFYVSDIDIEDKHVILYFEQTADPDIWGEVVLNIDDNVIVLKDSLFYHDFSNVDEFTEHHYKAIKSIPDNLLFEELKSRNYSGKISKSIEF